MNRLPMSRPAASLLRALLARAGDQRNRVFLIDVRSVDWQSLTFSGERHEMRFRIVGPEAGELVERLTGDICDATLESPGHVIADIALWSTPVHHDDGSITIDIEALTIVD